MTATRLDGLCCHQWGFPCSFRQLDRNFNTNHRLQCKLLTAICVAGFQRLRVKEARHQVPLLSDVSQSSDFRGVYLQSVAEPSTGRAAPLGPCSRSGACFDGGGACMNESSLSSLAELMPICV